MFADNIRLQFLVSAVPEQRTGYPTLLTTSPPIEWATIINGLLVVSALRKVSHYLQNTYMTYADIILSKLSRIAQHSQQEILCKVHYT